MKLLAVLLVALAATDLSGTSANDRGGDGDCLCFFPDTTQGYGFFALFPLSGPLPEQYKNFAHIMNGTLGRVALWLTTARFPPAAGNPDYIMDVNMNLLYKLEKDSNLRCTKAKLPDEWRMSNCFPSGLSLRTKTTTGRRIYENQDRTTRYDVYRDQNNFTKEEPCTPSEVRHSKVVANSKRFVFFSNHDLRLTGIPQNIAKVSLDLSSCTQVETLNFPFHPDSYPLPTTTTTTAPTTTRSTSRNNDSRINNNFSN